MSSGAPQSGPGPCRHGEGGTLSDILLTPSSSIQSTPGPCLREGACRTGKPSTMRRIYSSAPSRHNLRSQRPSPWSAYLGYARSRKTVRLHYIQYHTDKPGCQEDPAASVPRTVQFRQFSFFLPGDKLVDGPLVRHILRHFQIAQLPMPAANAGSFSWNPLLMWACTRTARTIRFRNGLNPHFRVILRTKHAGPLVASYRGKKSRNTITVFRDIPPALAKAIFCASAPSYA